MCLFLSSLQIITVLESPHTPEIKEQALCIIGNIAAGAGITDYVMENERILKKLFDFLVSIFNRNHCSVSHSNGFQCKLTICKYRFRIIKM